jgi:ankyrin repeat protein
MLLLMASIGHGRTALEARKELADVGIAFERSVFIERAKESDVVAVELFLEAGMNPTVADQEGRTAMVWAAIEDHVKILELFAAANVNMEGGAEDPNGRTLLHWAAGANSLNAAQFLIKAGADLNARDKQGDTPLLYAVKRNHEGVVKLLLDAGADVNARDANGFTPVLWATLHGWTEGFELLRAHGADLNVRVKTGATVTDSSTGGWYVVEAGSSILTIAASRGYTGIAKRLLETEARPNYGDGVSALIKAASNGHAAVVALLLDAEVPVDGRNAQNRTALFYASQNGDAEIVRTLLAKGATRQMDLALINAVTAGYGSITRILMQAGADADVALDDWRRIVRVARDRGYTNIVEMLRGPRTELVTDYREPTTRDIRHFQGCLQAFGYDPGSMDGVLGDMTVAALRQFQEQTGLLESGLLDAATRDALIEKGCPRIAAPRRP